MYQEILTFWFNEIDPSTWWRKDAEFDRMIIERFGVHHASATRCELFAWRASPQGRLAEIIVLDQFSRNMYRDSPQAFFADPLALALAQEAVLLGADQALSSTERNFLYMPYMHSESPIIHEVAVTLFESNGGQANVAFELKHKKIIDQFGRYPHRNQILGRQSTEAEVEFLKGPNSHF